MRKYVNKRTEKLKVIYCNLCGKEINMENGIITEGVFTANQKWGYFSGKDGQADSFDLCEECYNSITEKFAIPVESSAIKELI